MPHYACPHAARVSLSFFHGTAPIRCELTFAVRDTTDAIFADPGTFSTAFFDAFKTDLRAYLPDVAHFDNVIFEDVRAVPYVGNEFAQTPYAGTLAPTNAYLPTSISFAIKRLTSTLGRSGRGRLYWPVWVDNMLASADTLDATLATNIENGLGLFQTALGALATPVELGIISRQHAGVLLNPMVFEPITSWGHTDLYVDSQRRRLLGRGN